MDTIHQIDVLAMLRERHKITEEAHIREAIAIASHEGVHLAAAVALGLCRHQFTTGRIFLTLGRKARRRGNSFSGVTGHLPEDDAFIALVGPAWERAYLDGTEATAGQDVRGGLPLAAMQGEGVYRAAEEFIEQHGHLFPWVGVYLLANMPKGGRGDVATRHLWKLAQWLRPRLSLPKLPTVSRHDQVEYGRIRPDVVLPPPRPGLRRFACPVTFSNSGPSMESNPAMRTFPASNTSAKGQAALNASGAS